MSDNRLSGDPSVPKQERYCPPIQGHFATEHATGRPRRRAAPLRIRHAKLDRRQRSFASRLVATRRTSDDATSCRNIIRLLRCTLDFRVGSRATDLRCPRNVRLSPNSNQIAASRQATRPRRIAANIAKLPELLLRRAALEAHRRRQACYIVRDANALAFAYVYYEDDRRMPWRHQMTEPITDEKFYNEHAALLGHVALAWNDCHSVVLSIFHTLSGVSWPNASSIFLALKSDHDRRETTLALMDQVLNTANDGPIRDQGAQLLGQLGNLGYEGTVATHTMWVTVIRQRKVDASKNLAKS